MTAKFLPMLAVRGEPFDSPQHLFEVKWDGVRAVAAVEAGGWQVWGRDLADYQLRYPELEVLRRLPGGTVLDGELVLLQHGRPTLEGILRRHQLVSPRKIQYASRQWPVTYVLFDLLSWQGRELFDQPLSQRRARLEELLQGLAEPRLAFSAGVIGPGREFFDQAVAQGHEGVMAKYLASPYVPGRRLSSWRKMKPRLVVPCVIIGYIAGRNGLQGLVVAAEREGALQYAATITLGLSPEVRARLGPRLARRIRPTPVIPCRHRATWVEPEFYCQVRCLERTARGRLRSACFQGLLGEAPGVPGPSPTSP
jgi:ATP-dependent DNA ligase